MSRRDCPQRPEVLVPRHVRLLCRIAVSAGLSVEDFVAEEETETTYGCLRTTWRGSAEAFERTNYFTSSQIAFFKYPTAEKRALNVPMSALPTHNPLLLGDMVRGADGLSYHAWFYGVPRVRNDFPLVSGRL